MSETPGTLFIVAAPSGAGKSSIVNAVLARDPRLCLSISFTSRQPRPGERHAEHYNFVTADEFKAMVAAGDFFEHALVHGDWKGTARQSVLPQLAAGKDVVLEIDWQGARQVRRQIPDAIGLFILPPSRAALVARPLLIWSVINLCECALPRSAESWSRSISTTSSPACAPT